MCLRADQIARGCPKATSAPNGRTANPAAKAANANMKPVTSLTPEKNCALMAPASNPYK